MVGITQAIVMLSMGYFGNHGAVSLISYTLPGLMAEIVSLFFKNKQTLSFHVLVVTVANIAGAITVTIIVMRLATIPFIISLIAAAISGIVGGIISFSMFNKLKKFRII